ncbi:MAG: LCP family protein [Acidimicrobiales bacterium]
MGGEGPGWEAACPQCLHPLGPFEASAAALRCESCELSFAHRDGVWRFLTPDRTAPLERFLADYHTVRRAEGRGSEDPAYYRRLPEPAPDDPLAWQWALRARTWSHVRRRILPELAPGSRVVDLGAGVGWLSHRLGELGFAPLAVDLSDDPLDGLGAIARYSGGWPVVQAEFDLLPLPDACADLVIFNASLHYSTDYRVTLAEALRVLRPNGRLLVLDSPLYRRSASGRQMVAERHAEFEARFGVRSDSAPAVEYLTEGMLVRLADELGLVWRRSRPWYGWRWALRPLRAKLRRRREPSRFVVLLAERVAGAEPAPLPAEPAPLPAEPRRLARTWPQRLVLAAGAVSALTGLAAAAGLGLVGAKTAQIQRVALGVELPAPSRPAGEAGGDAAAPVNVLVVGIDNAAGLAPGDRRRREAQLHSDTIMLLRLDPASGLAALLSFPRDLWLRIGEGGPQSRINTALPLGGPDLLIETIRANFALDVHHYVEIDFAQFGRLVDAVGGIPMPFDRPVRDDWSGLWVGEAGCVVLDGDTALDYVRARHLQVYDGGRWQADPLSDLSRIRRQQDFVRRSLQQARAKGLANPVTANRLIDVGLDSVTIDESFSVAEILALARRFRSLDPEQLLTYSLPTRADTTSGGAQILRLLPEEAAPTLDIFRGVNPDSPAAVPVTVRGGDALAAALSAAGFPAVAASPAAAPARTTIRYAAGSRYRAELLARWLSVEPVLTSARLPGSGVELTVGLDGVTVLAEPRRAGSHWEAEPAGGVLPGEGKDLCTG